MWFYKIMMMGLKIKRRSIVFKKSITLLALILFIMFPVRAQAYDFDGAIDENGKIVKGTEEDVDLSNYTIIDGVFNGEVKARDIEGGTFYGDVDAYSITGGTFYGKVVALNITGGTFYDDVNVNEEATISGGTFNKYVYTSFTEISGGTFNHTVLVTGGSVTGGTFNKLQACPAGTKGCTIKDCVITGILELLETPWTDVPKIKMYNVTLQTKGHVSIIGLDENCYKDAFSSETDEKLSVMMSNAPARYLPISCLKQGQMDKLTIAFDANGGTGQMESYWNYVHGNIQLPYSTFTKAGTEFKEWNTKPDGSGKAVKENMFFYTGIDHKKDDVITIYAQWKDGSTGKADDTENAEGKGTNNDSVKPQDGGKTTETGKSQENNNTDETGKSQDNGITSTPGKQESKALKKGDKITLASGTYRLTAVSKKQITAEFYSAPKNKAKITIKSSFKKNGKTIKVTSIRAKAFFGNKKVTNVTIPDTVTNIGSKAFYNMKSAKTITINANKKLKIGKGAFQKMKKGSVINIKGLKKKEKEKIVKKVVKEITKKNTKVK